MKSIKIIIAVFLVLSVTAACFSACKKNTEEAIVTLAVTDENGEAVTDGNGDAVTEIAGAGGEEISVSLDAEDASKAEAASQAAASKDGTKDNSGNTDSAETTKSDGKKSDKKSDKTTTAAATTAAPIEKPAAPDAPTDFKAAEVTESTIKLTWSKVKCTGYILYRFEDNGKVILDSDNTKKTSYTFKKLPSDTKFYFVIVAYNKNEAGSAISSQVQTTAKTKEDTSKKARTIVVKLPTNLGETDTLTVTVKDKDGKKDTIDLGVVELNGVDKIFTTDKKYAGNITVTAALKDNDVSNSVVSDKDTIELDVSGIGVDIIEGGDF